MKLTIQSYTGNQVNLYKKELAALRIKVFREFPYLYDGTLDYEEKYLESLIRSEESIIVVAFADDSVIGMSTGMPLKNEPAEIKQPWTNHGFDVNDIYYFSESVLLKEYRGIGIGLKFFDERESWAKNLNFSEATFCAVIRAEDHPAKPSGYTPLDEFWYKRGYKRKDNLTCKMSWKEVCETMESVKELQFWYKHLI